MTTFKNCALSLYALMLLLVGSFSPNSSWAANLSVPKMDDAVHSYKDRQYSQSLAQFKQLHNSGTCNELIHYYMALNYQALNQIGQAKNEYTTVAKGRVPSLRVNANYALAQLNRWGQHRAYEGQGNNFQRYSIASSRTGKGSSAARFNPPAKEIIIDMPPPTGGGC